MPYKICIALSIIAMIVGVGVLIVGLKMSDDILKPLLIGCAVVTLILSVILLVLSIIKLRNR